MRLRITSDKRPQICSRRLRAHSRNVGWEDKEDLAPDANVGTTHVRLFRCLGQRKRERARVLLRHTPDSQGGHVVVLHVGWRIWAAAGDVTPLALPSVMLQRGQHKPRLLSSPIPLKTGASLVARKPNYDFEKRRKEIERKQKKEAKKLRRQENSENQTEDPPTEESSSDGPPPNA